MGQSGSAAVIVEMGKMDSRFSGKAKEFPVPVIV